MKKVLFVAHVVKRHFMLFHIPYVKWFKENGYETHVCANNDYENKEDCNIPYCDKYYDLPFQRSPFSAKNITAYKELKKLIDENEYDIIHCHTPVGGVLTRLVAREARKKGTKVIYTAHGFHFFKGAPLINWMLFYPVEKFCARFTDVLITINKEDYNRTKKSFKAGKVEYVPGVGVDTKKFSEVVVDKLSKRRELGIPDDAFVVLSVGELNKNKNHEVVIKAIAQLNNPNVYYVICGQGVLGKYLNELAAELGVKDKVKFLGFRKNIPEISKVSDLFAFMSYREGLSLALMEAMASGLPVVCSNVRGNRELIEDKPNGTILSPNCVKDLTKILNVYYSNREQCISIGKLNEKKVKEYDVSRIKKEMISIYNQCLNFGGYHEKTNTTYFE